MNKKLLHFTAEWCGPCKAMQPVMSKIYETYGDQLQFEKIDVDQDRETTAYYNVTSVPTFILLENGEVVNRTRGAQTSAAMISFLKLN